MVVAALGEEEVRMIHTIALSENAERAIATIAAELGLTLGEYLRRLREAWAARLTSDVHDADQAWFWTPEWQAGECAVNADRAAGRSIRYESDEAFLRALEEHISDPTRVNAGAD
jgi:hypothetical protein